MKKSIDIWFKYGLFINIPIIIACIFAIVAMFPFILTEEGWLLISSIICLSFFAFYWLQKKILGLDGKFKSYWCRFDWLIAMSLLVYLKIIFRLEKTSGYLPYLTSIILWAIGFGFLLASVISKISEIRKDASAR